jgi:fructose-1,6-bisphosphatase I
MKNESVNHFLRRIGVENDLRSLLYHIARSAKYINFSLRAGNTGVVESENSSGEQQLKLDVLADQIVMAELEKSELAALVVSEEQEEAVRFEAPRGTFSIAYDPLDGSSLFDANLSIGSIFGIWEGDDLLGNVGENLIASCYAVYGPRVLLVIAVKGLGTHELEMNDVGEFMLTRENIELDDTTKYFSPGNMRGAIVNEKYAALIQAWMMEKRTLRYSGGMVPDLHHILSKGEGIFTYPGDEKHPNGKLRLLFECAPYSLLFEEAGAKSVTADGTPILDLECTDIHQRTTIVIGSSQEVDRVIAALN